MIKAWIRGPVHKAQIAKWKNEIWLLAGPCPLHPVSSDSCEEAGLFLRQTIRVMPVVGLKYNSTIRQVHQQCIGVQEQRRTAQDGHWPHKLATFALV